MPFFLQQVINVSYINFADLPADLRIADNPRPSILILRLENML